MPAIKQTHFVLDEELLSQVNEAVAEIQALYPSDESDPDDTFGVPYVDVSFRFINGRRKLIVSTDGYTKEIKPKD